MMSVINIVLADDHHVVRQGIRALLEAEPDCRIVGEASNGLEACKLVEDLQPDVLLVDVSMPDLNGLEVTRQVTRRSPRTRVAILSMHANEAYVMEALRNGAAGYILKDSTATDLVHAVHEVAARRRYLSPPLSEHVIEAYLEKAKETTLDRFETLTTREREVFYLVAEGKTNSEIAQRLYISRRTVEIHRANMMHKLGLRTKTDLIRYALRRENLPLPLQE